jgi:glycine/D-amino acid oxidase-like deaminating enzyme
MGALWMERGDDKYVRDAIPILHDLGFEVDKLTVDEAAKRYPQIDFKGVKTVYFERKAGALYARHACVVIRDQFDKKGGVYETATAKPGPIKNGSMSYVLAGDKKLEADAYVFAAGPWLGKLFPDVIGDRVLPTRQEVYYFATPAGAAEQWSANHLPIWIDFGPHIVYGIPDVEGKWLKVADDTRGEKIDPTTQDRHPRKELIERARQFLAERFPKIAQSKLLDAEVCQYENSPDGNLIIDRHPNAKNVWLLGGGSGHGFKLAPAVGALAADAILANKPVPETFRLERLRGGKRKTQFETTTTS